MNRGSGRVDDLFSLQHAKASGIRLNRKELLLLPAKFIFVLITAILSKKKNVFHQSRSNKSGQKGMLDRFRSSVSKPDRCPQIPSSAMHAFAVHDVPSLDIEASSDNNRNCHVEYERTRSETSMSLERQTP